MADITLGVKPIYVDWKAHCQKIKAVLSGWQKSTGDLYCPEFLSEVDLVQRVFATSMLKEKYSSRYHF